MSNNSTASSARQMQDVSIRVGVPSIDTNASDKGESFVQYLSQVDPENLWCGGVA